MNLKSTILSPMLIFAIASCKSSSGTEGLKGVFSSDSPWFQSSDYFESAPNPDDSDDFFIIRYTCPGNIQETFSWSDYKTCKHTPPYRKSFFLAQFLPGFQSSLNEINLRQESLRKKLVDFVADAPSKEARNLKASKITQELQENQRRINIANERLTNIMECCANGPDLIKDLQAAISMLEGKKDNLFGEINSLFKDESLQISITLLERDRERIYKGLTLLTNDLEKIADGKMHLAGRGQSYNNHFSMFSEVLNKLHPELNPNIWYDDEKDETWFYTGSVSYEHQAIACPREFGVATSKELGVKFKGDSLLIDSDSALFSMKRAFDSKKANFGGGIYFNFWLQISGRGLYWARANDNPPLLDVRESSGGSAPFLCVCKGECLEIEF
jgi:hypothetical protein